MVTRGECTDPEIDTRQVEAFPRAELSADPYRALYVPAFDTDHFELDITVIQEKRIPLLHGLGKTVKGHGHTGRIADDVFRGQREGIARPEFDRLRIDLPDPHLRPREIGHDRNAAPAGYRGGPEVLDDFLVGREVSVGEVQPGHVHTCLDHLRHHCR